MTQPNNTDSKSAAVKNRLQAQTQALNDLDRQHGFLAVQFGSAPAELLEGSLAHDLGDIRIFIRSSRTEQLGAAVFKRIEYEYFQEKLLTITLFADQDEGNAYRPIFDYLVAMFGHSMNRTKAKQFAPIAKSWSSKRVRMDYYNNSGLYNVTRDPKLPPAQGACLAVTSTEIETQQRKAQRQRAITEHKTQGDTAWQACKLELEDQGWKIGCKVRRGANADEVIIELAATHRDLADVDVQLPWPRGIKATTQDAALLNPAYAILEKRIALLHQKRR